MPVRCNSFSTIPFLFIQRNTMKNKTKYFIGYNGQSANWYLIPYSKLSDWNRWLGGPSASEEEEDEDLLSYYNDVPDFAEYVSDPSDVVFENPKLVN